MSFKFCFILDIAFLPLLIWLHLFLSFPLLLVFFLYSTSTCFFLPVQLTFLMWLSWLIADETLLELWCFHYPAEALLETLCHLCVTSYFFLWITFFVIIFTLPSLGLHLAPGMVLCLLLLLFLCHFFAYSLYLLTWSVSSCDWCSCRTQVIFPFLLKIWLLSPAGCALLNLVYIINLYIVAFYYWLLCYSAHCFSLSVFSVIAKYGYFCLLNAYLHFWIFLNCGKHDDAFLHMDMTSLCCVVFLFQDSCKCISSKSTWVLLWYIHWL